MRGYAFVAWGEKTPDRACLGPIFSRMTIGSVNLPDFVRFRFPAIHPPIVLPRRWRDGVESI